MQTLTSEGLLDAVRRWVAIESPTQDVAAVNRMADHAEALLRGAGAGIERIPGTMGYGDILIGRIPGETEGPGILLLGHIDTVHPVGTLTSALPWRIEGDRAYGPGIYDMKGGNAIAVAALAHLRATGRRPHMPVTVMFIPDEEAGSPSSRARIEAEARRHTIVLVAEPSGDGGRLTVARHGIARYYLKTTGIPAHAGAYHAKGRSAIREMARQILAVEAMTDYDRTITLNVGTMSGGTHENMVPIHAEACVYVLVPSAEAEAEVRAKLLALTPHDPDVELEVTLGLYRPSYGKTPAIQALYDHAAGLARELGFEVAGERVAGGGSDGNFTGALGIPTLDGLGVIGDGPHTHHEHLLISCLVPRTRLYVRLFETLTPGVVAG
ncbi:M20 family metallopeptidase [Phreatobacter cathodiphilus]|uniref:Carboxypeptidase n=1 Tax=Phreatobacter cathodiphilus TaxID=1868589 RepID=A0A2S0N974_9HYPH|nr:M20 family metallopeptidase [Phreatobacter cathodiphilus]AVO44491.1 carboxypeptidase [Phreatobacter cathodiphilus]